MHELTVSEAATILAILSREGLGDNADIAASGIPASTYYATRRRIYEAGWLSDRYLPNPWASGVASIDFVLAHPGPADRGRLEREWASREGNVLLWSGPNVVLGIFFRPNAEAPSPEDGSRISVTPDAGSVPVYFDFSRPWARFIDVERETLYPRPLQPPAGALERTSASKVRELVASDQAGKGEPSAPHRWHSTTDLSRGQQRSLERGLVESRTFLNLDSLPPYRGRELGEIVFLTGRLREGVSSTDVLGSLDRDCRVSPFLLADDGSQVLLLALGQVATAVSRRTRIPRATHSVASTLDEALKGVQMTVEPTWSVMRPTDHRYDRAAPLPPGVKDREGP